MNLATWKLHGPVRTLSTEHAEWDSDRGEWRAPRGQTTVTFRSDGQTSETESHNPDGSILRSVRTYDDAGRILAERTWKDEGTEWEVAYSYDVLGRLAQKEVLSKEGRWKSEECRYDDAGRQTKAIFLPPHVAGSSIGIAAQGPEFFPDDPTELPAAVSFHFANGGIVGRVVFEIDPERRLVTEVMYPAGDNPFGESQPAASDMSPDERVEMLAAIKAAFSNDVFSKLLYVYDARGRLIERTMSMGMLSEERRTSEYEDRDDPIAETTKSWDHGVEQLQREQQTRFDYQYDSRGNWTERIVRYRIGSQQEFQRSNVERRTIAYYEPQNDSV
jgi:hypothetical protein